MKKGNSLIIPPVEERVYRFIRDYGKRVYLRNIELFGRIHKYPNKEIHGALAKLKEKGRVIGGKNGFFVVRNPKLYQNLSEKWLKRDKT
jgi:hypothetical protein